MSRWWAWLLAGVVLGALGNYVAARQHRDTWERRTDSLLATGALRDSLRQEILRAAWRWKLHADSAEAEAHAAGARANMEASARHALTRGAAALRDSLAHTDASDSTRVLVALVAEQDRVIASYQAENVSLRRAFAEQRAASASLRALVATYQTQLAADSVRIADLESLLRTRPPPARCRVLVVSCEALVAVGVGASVLLALR